MAYEYEDDEEELSTKQTVRMPLSRRIFKSVVKQDLRTVMANTIEEEVVPGFMNFLADSAHTFIDEALSPPGGYSGRYSSGSGKKDHDYTKHSKSKSSTRSRTSRDDDDISSNDWGPMDTGSLPMTREKAYEVMHNLCACKKRFPDEPVSTSQFYQEADAMTSDFTVNDWGWPDMEDLQSARIVSKGYGANKRYYIRLPRPVKIT